VAAEEDNPVVAVEEDNQDIATLLNTGLTKSRKNNKNQQELRTGLFGMFFL
jgi:hypothetical protein